MNSSPNERRAITHESFLIFFSTFLFSTVQVNRYWGKCKMIYFRRVAVDSHRAGTGFPERVLFPKKRVRASLLESLIFEDMFKILI